jgi:3-oxoacyl-[acyl-carrier protein] reductase
MRLEGKTALITGGAGDIAVAIAKAFLGEGARIVLFDIDKALLKEKEGFLSAGSALQSVVGDVTKLEDLAGAAAIGEKQFGKVDILVTCAGLVNHTPIDELSVNDWNRIVAVNLTGTFLACKAVVPKMKERKYGRIVTISSIGGRTGRPGVGVDYSATKAGVVGITQTLARELGSYNITANSIAPGPIEGRMRQQLPPGTRDILASNSCIPRPGCPEDVANAALFLASDEAGWVTGEVLDVNGGILI